MALLGCIADDFTGGTDLAGMLVGAGMRTVQMIGVPQAPLPDGIDAVVIALKSRTIEPQAAIEVASAMAATVVATRRSEVDMRKFPSRTADGPTC